MGGDGLTLYNRPEVGGGYIIEQYGTLEPRVDATALGTTETDIDIDIADSFGWPGTLIVRINELELAAETSNATSLGLSGPLGIEFSDLTTYGKNAGLHLRRDWQEGSLIYGMELEAKALFDDGAKWNVIADTSLFDGSQLPISAQEAVQVQTDALVALKGRAGYAVGPAMGYLTAGIGFAHVTGNLDKAMLSAFPIAGLPSTSERTSQLLFGPVAGAGAAVQLNERVSLSSEVLYYQFMQDLVFSDQQSVGLGGALTADVRLSFRLD